jgi:prepilin-type N-terminal cleavage/methylation domain-containing protein
MLRADRISRSRGLTLIEVMVAIGVLVILASGIFFVVQTTLSTVMKISDRSSRDDEITNLVDILRSNFRNLPPRSELTARVVTDGGTPMLLFVVRNAPGFLTWLKDPESEDTIVLLAARQDDDAKTWRVCLKRFAPPAHFSSEDFKAKDILRIGEKVPWLELVGDFREVGMRFFDEKKKNWVTEWVEPKRRPSLIELRLVSEITKDPRSETTVLWIPPVQGGAS